MCYLPIAARIFIFPNATRKVTMCEYGELLFAFAAKLGANAVLGVSLAVCKAGAAHKVKLLSGLQL